MSPEDRLSDPEGQSADSGVDPGGDSAMAAWLTEGMTLLAHLVDGADTETFKIGTDAHGAAQKLMASLESVMTGALFDTLTNNGNST